MVDKCICVVGVDIEEYDFGVLVIEQFDGSCINIICVICDKYYFVVQIRVDGNICYGWDQRKFSQSVSCVLRCEVFLFLLFVVSIIFLLQKESQLVFMYIL